jgi:hypothetical protein
MDIEDFNATDFSTPPTWKQAFRAQRNKPILKEKVNKSIVIVISEEIKT